MLSIALGAADSVKECLEEDRFIVPATAATEAPQSPDFWTKPPLALPLLLFKAEILHNKSEECRTIGLGGLPSFLV